MASCHSTELQGYSTSYSPQTAQTLPTVTNVKKILTNPIRKMNNSHANSPTFVIASSVIPSIWKRVLLYSLWGAFVTSLVELCPLFKDFGVSSVIITILGVVLGLLLVFRNNTAYDRYWEARRLWGTLFTHTRNLSRYFWIATRSKTDEELIMKRGAMNLLLAFSLATKYYLRGQDALSHSDIHSLLLHLPLYKPGAKRPEIDNLPLEISFHLSSYVSYQRSNGCLS
jgi:ion channel-forming bestrophin family protein